MSGDAVVEEAFAAADAALAQAARAGRAGELRLRVAGLAVRIRFAGAALAPMLAPAFGHLAVPADEDGSAPDDLVVTVIDGGLPEAAALAGCAAFAGASGAAPSAPCADYGDSALVLPDFARGRCLQWVRDVAAIPAWAAASPLRTLLGRFLATRDRYLVHGAAIGRSSGALLVAAKGNSGKSTCALACLEAHGGTGTPWLSVAGDDFIVLEPGVMPPRAHSLFATAKIGRAHAARFPGLASHIARDGGPLDRAADKVVVRLFPDLAERLAAALPLRAIAVPALDLSRDESRVEPLSRAEALLALAPSSIFLVPGSGGETLEVIAALVVALPTYRLRIGSDVRGIPAAIEEILASFDRHDPLASPAAHG